MKEDNRVVIVETKFIVAPAPDSSGWMAVFAFGEKQLPLGPFPTEEWAEQAGMWAMKVYAEIAKISGCMAIIAYNPNDQVNPN